MWRGESLSGKSILLLEEQAIGDVMMFCSLITTIIDEASQVGLFLRPLIAHLSSKST